jgi:hypothetical protein
VGFLFPLPPLEQAQEQLRELEVLQLEPVQA